MRWRKTSDDDQPGDDPEGRDPSEPPHAPGAGDVEEPEPAGDTVTEGPGQDREPRPASPPDVPDHRAPAADLARAVRRAVSRALAEDLGDRGDVTSMATVPPGTRGRAELVARGEGVVCGLAAFTDTFGQVDPRVELQLDVEDGAQVTAGQRLGVVTGPLRSILTAERTALNFLTHLSGIATQTRRFADAVAGTGVQVRDTRKTTPGLRLLEKDAVRVGGGANHRIGLHDALLVKDNHVAAAGSVTDAFRSAADAPHDLHVQIEVADIAQLEEALDAGATDIMLDNFTPDEVRAAVDLVAGRASLEVSGSVDLDRIAEYAVPGVDRIAVGRLTHSAPALDIALDVLVDAVERPERPRATFHEPVLDTEPEPEGVTEPQPRVAREEPEFEPESEVEPEPEAESEPAATETEPGPEPDDDEPDAPPPSGGPLGLAEIERELGGDEEEQDEDEDDEIPGLFAWRERQRPDAEGD